MEKTLSDTFKYHAKIVLLTVTHLEQIINEVPKEWLKKNNLRCYIAYVINIFSTADCERNFNQ